MSFITAQTFHGYVDQPLVENDLTRFDTFQDGELKPVDFEGKETLLDEFVSRYVASSSYIRGKYRDSMSSNMQVVLCWRLSGVWKKPDLKEEDKDKIAEVLRRDFRVKVKNVTDRESVLVQFYRSSYWTGVGGGADVTKDPLRNSRDHTFYTYLYGGTYRPFRLMDDLFLLSAKMTLAGNYVKGERQLEGEDPEAYDYFGGRGLVGMSFRDLKNESWGMGGEIARRERGDVPDGFFERNLEWNGYASIDHLLGTPLRLGGSASGITEFYAPPPEPDQNHRHKEEFNGTASLVFDLSTSWALLGSYTHLRSDQTSTYSTRDKIRHSGSILTRRRSLDGYVDVGVVANRPQTVRSYRTEAGTQTEAFSEINGGPKCGFFRRLGEGKSISGQLIVVGIKSSGDIEATYGGYYASLTADAYLLARVLEGSLTGEVDHKLIYQADREYELWYAARPKLTLHVTDDVTVGVGGAIEQTRNTGGLNERSMNVSGNTFANVSFDVLNGLNLTLTGYGGRSWDQNPDATERNFDERSAGVEFEAELEF